MFGKRISTRYVKSTILQLLNPIYLATTDSTLLPWPGDTSFRFWSVVATFLLSQGFNAESTMQNTAFLSLRRLSNFAALLLTFARTLLHSLVKETFFSSPVTQRTDPAHWGRTNVAEVVFHEPVLPRCLLWNDWSPKYSFLKLRSPSRFWFMMAWHFKSGRQKLRWHFTNMIYTNIITHNANIVVVFTPGVTEPVLHISVARSASYHLLQQGWIFLQFAIFMSLNPNVTSAKCGPKIPVIILP